MLVERWCHNAKQLMSVGNSTDLKPFPSQNVSEPKDLIELEHVPKVSFYFKLGYKR